MRSIKKYAAVAMAVSALAMTAACGDDAETDTTSGSETTAPADNGDSGDNGNMDDMDPAAYLVGPGCADYAEAVPDGDGSVQGMAMLPVADAASANPLLKTLVAAVSGGVNPDVNLVDTLNSGEFTVFAPTDDAFAALFEQNPDLQGQLAEDADLLSTVLTYHVLDGKVLPDDVTGKQTTLQGGELTVRGQGDNLKVNGNNVICGGVQTANAIVYLVDGVLVPKA